MGKVSRKKLGRGIELTVSQVFDPISGASPSMKTELENVNIEVDQREASYGTFRMNFNIPWLGSKYFHDNRTADPSGTARDVYDGPYYIPFCLPPTQDFFEMAATGAAPSPKEGAPVPIVQELSFSFDQGDEPAAIVSHWAGRNDYDYASVSTPGGPLDWVPSPYEARTTYRRPDAYHTTITLYEKDQTYFSTSDDLAETLKPKAEVFSVTFQGATFAGRELRPNPVVVPGINRQLNPFKTYVLAVYCPNLHDTDSTRQAHCVMNNVWISLRMKMRLMPRDEVSSGGGDVELQNAPAIHKGRKIGPSVTTATPGLPENLVIADGQDSAASEVGISTNLQAVDEMFSSKLRGGYQDFSQTYPSEMLKEDACYDVMSVNMGAGFAFNRMTASGDYRMAPYVSDYAFNPNPVNNPLFASENTYVDRRIIPIDSSFVIHHVIVAMNWSSDKVVIPFDPATSAGLVSYSSATAPTASGAKMGEVEYEIGVGMLQGPRSDNFDYQQIAYSKFTQDTLAATGQIGAIDAVDMGLPACAMDHEWKLMSVPILAQNATPTGTRYWGFDSAGGAFAYKVRGFGQGTPWFVGEGNTYTASRTAVGIDDGAGAIGPSSPFTLPPLAPDAMGCEQFLEVRLSVEPYPLVYTRDATGPAVRFIFQDQTAVGPPPIINSWSASDIFLGYGGCWVYIIGKKNLE